MLLHLLVLGTDGLEGGMRRTPPKNDYFSGDAFLSYTRKLTVMAYQCIIESNSLIGRDTFTVTMSPILARN